MKNNEKKMKTNEIKMKNTTKTMKHTEKNPRNGSLPNIEFGAMSRQGLENIIFCPFSNF